MTEIGAIKAGMRAWIDTRQLDWSNWNRTIWEFAEPAWREYQSCAFCIDRLRKEGPEMQEGSGGMRSALCGPPVPNRLRPQRRQPGVTGPAVLVVVGHAGIRQ